MRTLLSIAAILLVSGGASADDYSGEYVAQTEDGAISLVLEQSGAGLYSGTLNIGDYPLRIVAAVRGDVLQGALDDDGDVYEFTANKKDGRLSLHFSDDDFIVFEAGPAETGATQETPEREVNGGASTLWVNGRALSEQQISALEAYGLRAEPGRYWYDPVCGAWGIWGGPTAGFIQPRIPVPAALPRHASNGDTGVTINGREIARVELAYLQVLAQGPIYPGNYWLDAMGNAGAVGGPPLINFLQAAQAQQGGGNAWYGKGASGWSSADGSSGGVWISNPYGGTGTTVTY